MSVKVLRPFSFIHTNLYLNCCLGVLKPFDPIVIKLGTVVVSILEKVSITTPIEPHVTESRSYI